MKDPELTQHRNPKKYIANCMNIFTETLNHVNENRIQAMDMDFFKKVMKERQKGTEI
jgi:hypothetical protein